MVQLLQGTHTTVTMFAGGERRMNPRERMMHRQRASENARGDLQRYTRDIGNMTAANQRGQNIGGRIRANQSAIRATEAMFADQRRAVRCGPALQRVCVGAGDAIRRT